jgi:hypothetical protein
LIGLAGATGTGKTYTAMRLASGMSVGKRFAVIDTENGRASHYADRFAFDVAELRAPYTPERYTEAIRAADAAGYPVIVVDSMSHEYAGEGGILDMQEAEFERMGHREAVKVASWIRPKGEHKSMVQALLQTKAHLILCFRAEAKIEVVKGEDGKIKIVPKTSLVGLDGWIPIAEKSLPFELTVSLLFTPGDPGIPHPIKLEEQHRAFFPEGRQVTEESGRLIQEWASGGRPKERLVDQSIPVHIPVTPTVDLEIEPTITVDQAIVLEDACRAAGISTEGLKKKAKVNMLRQIKATDFERAQAFIAAAAAKRLASAKSGEHS